MQTNNRLSFLVDHLDKANASLVVVAVIVGLFFFSINTLRKTSANIDREILSGNLIYWIPPPTQSLPAVCQRWCTRFQLHRSLIIVVVPWINRLIEVEKRQWTVLSFVRSQADEYDNVHLSTNVWCRKMIGDRWTLPLPFLFFLLLLLLLLVISQESLPACLLRN